MAAELPNIYHVFAAWAELVALSPVLNTFEGSEVEILNDIPEYEGVAGLIGTVLALVFLAVGAVKKIYQTNESSGETARRKRSNQVDFYLDIIQMLDKQKCMRSLLCSVAQQSTKHKLSSDKRALMHTFGSKPNSVFSEAISLGRRSNSPAVCAVQFNQCPLSEKRLVNLFRAAQFFRNSKVINPMKRLWLKIIS
uniref:Uncharacterized protein n=1 Tax=Strigamia maritima TaxID=126957 RepID=T1JCA5_STRMM